MERLVVRLFVNTVEEIFVYVACFIFFAKCLAPKVKRAVIPKVVNKLSASGALLRPTWAPPAFWGLLSAFCAL